MTWLDEGFIPTHRYAMDGAPERSFLQIVGENIVRTETKIIP